ncbi:hypothetical protein [Aquimarina litoralis]|uniref:hypothetical protein n=1 Tax=Aquimarina litoralis TaxID=584605 RepID=UPI001C59598D|nr:hypothetical protein [Aquimarina litoralis]MBW1296877.1 hypothetical protein [Aquimarina litoralis]
MTFSKIIPYFAIIFFFLQGCKRENTTLNPLLAPDNWRKETLVFPLSFAPTLSYKGTEYVRFAPGWGKKGTEDYFTYAFLWYLDEKPTLDSKTLETDMEAYFNGLMQIVSKSEENSSTTIPKAKAFFEQLDESSYAGKVITYDAFITKKEVTLNVIATYSNCPELEKHLVLFKLSPQKIDHQVWSKLDAIQLDLDCD